MNGFDKLSRVLSKWIYDYLLKIDGKRSCLIILNKIYVKNKYDLCEKKNN